MGHMDAGNVNYLNSKIHYRQLTFSALFSEFAANRMDVEDGLLHFQEADHIMSN